MSKTPIEATLPVAHESCTNHHQESSARGVVYELHRVSGYQVGGVQGTVYAYPPQKRNKIFCSVSRLFHRNGIILFRRHTANACSNSKGPRPGARPRVSSSLNFVFSPVIAGNGTTAAAAGMAASPLLLFSHNTRPLNDLLCAVLLYLNLSVPYLSTVIEERKYNRLFGHTEVNSVDVDIIVLRTVCCIHCGSSWFSYHGKDSR